MSFYISLSGLKGAQSDLSTIANNVANANTNAFKRSTTNFGDIFSAAPMQTTTQVSGQGVRVVNITQQFTQGTVETTDKTLDLAITGEGFFTVKNANGNSAGAISYTRNGAFAVDEQRFVTDTTGARLQVFPIAVAPAANAGQPDMSAPQQDLQIPLTKPGFPAIQLSSVAVTGEGLISATYADDSTVLLGSVAMATFPSMENLRQKGDAHWTSTLQSGAATYGSANSGLFGQIRSGALERSNVDITEELVSLISAQRNFQANAKAIETAKTLSETIINLR